VHAAGNLLNLKLILDPPGIPPGTLVEHINSKLPPFIRIWGLTRVQNSFNARTSCDSRLYEYLLPTYVLLPPKPGSAMHEMMLKWQASEEEALAKSSKSDEEKAAARASKTPLQELLEHDFWKTQGTEHTYQEDVSAKKKWRIDAAHLENLRGAFAKYQGSHNFHNFTVGKEFRDRSAQRVMKRLEVRLACGAAEYG
jgi:tRNA pseudouridine38-40 synthase